MTTLEGRRTPETVCHKHRSPVTCQRLRVVEQTAVYAEVVIPLEKDSPACSICSEGICKSIQYQLSTTWKASTHV